MEDIQQALSFTPALPCLACNKPTNSGVAFTAESQELDDTWFNGTWVLLPLCKRVECQNTLEAMKKALQQHGNQQSPAT